MADEHHQPAVSSTDENSDEVPTNNDAPNPDPKPNGMTITFKDANGGEVSFKLKATTKLKKAMDAYSARAERDRRSLRFLFDGQRVLDESTPESVSRPHICRGGEGDDMLTDDADRWVWRKAIRWRCTRSRWEA